MPTFTPPTRTERIPPDRIEQRFGGRAGLFRHYGQPIAVGYSVLITSGVASASPGVVSPDVNQLAATDAGSGEDGKAWFTGGKTYTVTSAEQTILEAAGHTVT